jgi:import receptor subunit TOM22
VLIELAFFCLVFFLENLFSSKKVNNKEKMKMISSNGGLEDGDLDDFEDETLAERLWGLTEMFPRPVRSLTGALVNKSTHATKLVYSWSRVGLWVAASSFTVLVLPVIIENERSVQEEMQATQQRELLFGPSAASSASPNNLSTMPFGLAGGPAGGQSQQK